MRVCFLMYCMYECMPDCIHPDLYARKEKNSMSLILLNVNLLVLIYFQLPQLVSSVKVATVDTFISGNSESFVLISFITNYVIDR